MDNEDLIEQILAGASPEEQSTDLLYLCNTMAVNLMQRAVQVESGASLLPPRRQSRLFQDALQLSGEIWCPIFRFVKPADYIEKMSETRLRYRGIVGNVELQSEYASNLRELIKSDALTSLERAIERQVWQQLRPFK